MTQLVRDLPIFDEKHRIVIRYRYSHLNLQYLVIPLSRPLSAQRKLVKSMYVRVYIWNISIHLVYDVLLQHKRSLEFAADG
jgi:hypothetical protein